MKNDFQVFIDSDAFIGNIYPNDPHHPRAKKTFRDLRETKTRIVTNNFVVAETATVLSHRAGQSLARDFLEIIKRNIVPVIHIDEKLQTAAYRVFAGQEKKGMSVTDCANVVIIRQFRIPRIFSFDKVYTKIFNLEAVT